MTLIEDGVVVHMSIRSYMNVGKEVKMSVGEEERDVYKLDWLVLNGFDFCEQPGVAGAGIKKVFESAPTYRSEEEMDIKELTLEELKAERPDLVAEATVEKLAGIDAQLTAKDEAIASKDSEIESLKANAIDPDTVTALQEDVATLKSKVEEFEGEVAVWNEMATDMVKEAVRLRKEKPEAKKSELMAEAIQNTTDFDNDEHNVSHEPENDDLFERENVDPVAEQILEKTSIFR